MEVKNKMEATLEREVETDAAMEKAVKLVGKRYAKAFLNYDLLDWHEKAQLNKIIYHKNRQFSSSAY